MACCGSFNEVVTKLTHMAAPPCVPVIRSGRYVTLRAQDWSRLRLFHGGRTEAARQHGRYVGSALFVKAEVKSDDWNASWHHQANGALSDNPIAVYWFQTVSSRL